MYPEASSSFSDFAAAVLHTSGLYCRAGVLQSRSMKYARIALPLCLAAALLTSCGPQDKGHATPEAAEELAIISTVLPEIGVDEILELPAADEIHLLMADFASTANAGLASTPSGITMLHLACLFKKPELARCLLLDKADPDAVTAQGDTPLALAVAMRGAEDDTVTADTVIRLIDVLVAGGADITRHTSEDMPLLNYAGLNCFSEEVFLHLLDIGCPQDETTCQAPAMMGWNTALKRMLDAGAAATPNAKEAMLLMAAANLHKDTVELLLNAGTDVNGGQLAGTTPLQEAAGHLLSPAEEEESAHKAAVLDVCALLIKRGADPYLAEMRQEESVAFCAADILTKDAATVEGMKARGVEIAPKKIEFTQGIALLEAVGKASTLEQQVQPEAFEAIAQVLTPTPDMRQHHLYHEVLPMAVEILHGIDPVRTSRLVAAMPEWTSRDAWEQGAGSHLLQEITKCEQLVLPKGILCLAAEHRLQAGEVDAAADLVELLARCPDALAEIDQYARHKAPSFRAGAMAARLHQAGLPTPRDGDVELWLNQHNREATSPAVQKALLLTSLSRLWYGDMLPAEQEQMLAAMEEIGAREAAMHYRGIVQAMDNPEALDKLTENSDSWKFELEIATGQFILDNAAAFLSPDRENTD